MTEKSSADSLFEDIDENLKTVRFNISEAAAKSGRTEKDVRLMAVTKTVQPVYINHALRQGIDLIGENKVQELLSKLEYLEGSPEKHIIGHLQSNKVRKITGIVSMIESLDGESVANEISSRSLAAGITTDVLLEVNIGREEAKTGVMPEMLAELAAAVSSLGGIRIRGLMAVPPAGISETENRRYFAEARKMYEDLKSRYGKDVDTLSLGMSGDYVQAILEGSNLVRIGSAIFGARRY